MVKFKPGQRVEIHSSIRVPKGDRTGTVEWLPEGRMTVMVLLDGSKQVQSFWDCDLRELSAEKKAA